MFQKAAFFTANMLCIRLFHFCKITPSRQTVGLCFCFHVLY